MFSNLIVVMLERMMRQSVHWTFFSCKWENTILARFFIQGIWRKNEKAIPNLHETDTESNTSSKNYDFPSTTSC